MINWKVFKKKIRVSNLYHIVRESTVLIKNVFIKKQHHFKNSLNIHPQIAIYIYLSINISLRMQISFIITSSRTRVRNSFSFVRHWFKCYYNYQAERRYGIENHKGSMFKRENYEKGEKKHNSLDRTFVEWQQWRKRLEIRIINRATQWETIDPEQPLKYLRTYRLRSEQILMQLITPSKEFALCLLPTLRRRPRESESVWESDES